MCNSKTSISIYRRALLSAALLLTLGASHSTAATFDFGMLADPNDTSAGSNEGTWTSRATNAAIAGGAFDDLTDTFTVGGIGVVATAGNAGTSATTVAYLDGYSANKPAGLGACSTVSGTQCGTASDDNIGRAGDISGGAQEYVLLTFTEKVILDALQIRDRDHNVLSAGTILINDIVYTIGSSLSGFVGTVFKFSNSVGNPDFYIQTATVTAVPIPAALPLLTSAIGAFGFIGWRRRRKGTQAV